ncbi:MAG: hypothetical protein ABI333_26230 [bacterium]
MRRLLPILLLAAPVLATGCAASGGRVQPKVKASQPTTVLTPKADPARKDWHSSGRYWRDELGQLDSIPVLWNAINRHQDSLGEALNPGYRSYRIDRLVVTRRPPRRVGAGSTTPRPRPPDIDRPPVTQRGGPPLCRRACNHVRAICYAARRICRIASQLREYRALQTCKRATARCEDAQRAAARKCPACR